MKGARELDAKVTAPLFPRLHINDAANQGGPRAPPRNKMALYEQLSIPSSAHRFRDHAAVAVPVASPPPHHGGSFVGDSGGGGTVVPCSSMKGLGCSRERSALPLHYGQQAAAPPNDDIQSPSSRATNASTLRAGLASPSPKPASQTRPGVSQSAHGDDLSAPRNPCKRNLSNEDDFMVPTFVHSGTAQPPGEGQPSIARCSHSASQKENAKPTCSYSNQNPDIMGVLQEQPPAGILTSKKRERIDVGQKAKAIDTAQLLIANNVEAGLAAEGNAAGPSRMLKAFSLLEKDSSRLAGSKKCIEGRLRGHLQSSGSCVAEAARIRNGIDGTGGASTIWPNCGNLSGQTDDDNTHCTPTMDLDDSDCAATDSGSPILQDMEKNDEDSETSVVDSEPSFDISPDDVVGAIGPKHFWKARRAIVNQQRVFAVQVFELHRLIKVQKLIAASPQLLLEGNPYFRRSRKVPTRKQPHATTPEQTSRKDESQKEKGSKPMTETMRMPQHPPEISHKRPFGEILQNEPHSGGTSALFHMGSEGRPPGPWCFPPSGNQWLVPVMSPSEGLVYKPYAGPCPPSGAFMAPFFGGCGPLVAAAPVMGDCVSPAYGFPSPIQQPSLGFPGSHPVAPSYFQAPYGFPVANQVMSPPAMEQVILPGGNSDERSQSFSSDNMSNQRSEAAPGPRVHSGQNKDLQMSASSSPNTRALEGVDLLSSVVIFPPISEDSGAAVHVHNGDAMPRVIKVVPHNRRTATETAARIFQFIQEERQHHEPA